MKTIIFVAAVLFTVCMFSGEQALFSVTVPKKSVGVTQKIIGGFDVWSAEADNSGNMTYRIYAGVPALKKLSNIEGVLIRQQPQTQYLATDEQPVYRQYDEMNAAMKMMEMIHPDLAKFYTIGKSVDNRDINAIKISLSPMTNDTAKTEFVVVGLHHAREWISAEVALNLAEFLTEHYGDIPRIKEIVDATEIWIIPILNPDGYIYTWENDRMWRFNRKPHSDGSIGVDLNRNYDASWVLNGFDHGDFAFSEPETQAIRALIGDKKLPPQNNFTDSVKGLISYHSYGEYILYPPGSVPDPAPLADTMQKIGDKMGDMIREQTGENYKVGQINTTLYQISGDITEWFMNNHDGQFGYTVELRPRPDDIQNFKLYADQIEVTVKENIPPALYYLEYLIYGKTDIDTDRDKNGTVDYYEGIDFDGLPDNDTEEPDATVVFDDTIDEAAEADNAVTADHSVPAADHDTTDAAVADLDQPVAKPRSSSGCSVVF